MKTPILKLFSWVVLGNVSRQLAFLIVNAVLFERLSRGTFGGLTLAFGYMSVFAGLGEFGIRYAGWREVARYPDRAASLAGSYLGAKTFTAILATLAYLLLLPVLWTVDASPSLYVLYGLGILLNGSTFDFPLFGLNRIDLFAKFSVVAFSFYIAACLLLIREDREAWLVPVFFALSMLLLALLEFTWFLVSRGMPSLRFSSARILAIFRESWSLGLAETVNRVTVNYPLILIGFLLGAAEVGNYRISEMIYAFLAQLGHMYAAAGYTQLSSIYEHHRQDLKPTIRRMAVWAFSGGLLAGLALAILGPLLYQTIFGSLHQDTVLVLRILGIALFFAGPTRFLRGLLASIDRQLALLALNLFNVAVGVSIGLILITRVGIVGMALAVAISEAVTLLGLFSVYHRTFRSTGRR